MQFDAYYMLFVLLWAAVNYLVVKTVVGRVKDFQANPVLYALGSIIFGGIYPLLFFVIKYLYWYNKYKNKNKGGKQL